MSAETAHGVFAELDVVEAPPLPRIRAGRGRVHPLGGRAPAPRRPAVRGGPGLPARRAAVPQRLTARARARRCRLARAPWAFPPSCGRMRGNRAEVVSPDWVDAYRPGTGGGRLRIKQIALTFVTGARDGFWPIQRVGGALCVACARTVCRRPTGHGRHPDAGSLAHGHAGGRLRGAPAGRRRRGDRRRRRVARPDDRRARSDQRRAPARPAPPRLRGRGPRAQRRDQGGAWRLGCVPGRRRRLVAAQAAPPARDGARRPSRLRVRAGGARALPGRRGTGRRSAAARQPGAAPARR